ncbi:MAG: SDR family oxidoreductase [Alphaproteobacteria bacterium]|nr:SDR family oxidoreductase [Alphaproteobacteria bacterium]
MDLGLKGRKAIVCASSRGLGRACATALAEDGVDVVINGRDAAVVASTAEAIAAATGVTATPVVADLDTEAGRAKLLEACAEPDILVNNNGGPPPGGFRDWQREEWDAGITANMMTPIELIKVCVDGMIERRFGRIVNVTSVAVRMPFPGLAMSSAARSGLTGFVASLSREVAPYNVAVNNLQPGLFETDRLAVGMKGAAEARQQDVETVRAGMLANIPAGRFGVPDEFGRACAFLCSAHAGFITGQNLLLDGGHFPGAF